jgi:aspartate/methionine/tyrosine aminotransferase
MTLSINPHLARVVEPPIAEAYGWVEGRTFPDAKPLIDVCQAVPGYPPPEALTDHLAQAVKRPLTARYTDIEGMDELRAALARDVVEAYGGTVAPGQVLIAAGCNQAFCFSMLALAKPGDEIVLPLPWYFNHKMWLDMQGVTAVPLPFRPDQGGVPDIADAEAAITEKTRAIVLISPNNPTGALYPAETIRAFFDLCRRRNIALAIDETYRDFLGGEGRAHDLFGDANWPDALVHLYSFSKVFCLTGYRVGAVVADRALIAQIAKAMDTVAICAPRIGQEAALWGLKHLAEWRAGNRMMMRARLEAFETSMRRNDNGYRIVSAGAYFAYVAHPFDARPAATVARRLADEENLLSLPGSMFGPGQDRYLRFAFANVAAETMASIAERLASDTARG